MAKRDTWHDWIGAHPAAISILTLAAPLTILVISAANTDLTVFSSHFAASGANLLGYYNTFFISAVFAVFFAAILVLERLRPADPDQVTLSRGLLFDTAFSVVSLATHFLFGTLSAILFLQFFSSYVPPLSGLVESWPNWLRVAIVFIIIDFASWASHVIRHKVPFLWHFHALHHAQSDMNLMTEFRIHPCDLLAKTLTVSFVFVLLLIPTQQALIYILLQKYYLMFQHANIDISYGPLDRIFVSPRVHRLHHAIRPDLHDQNYGVYLSIWDTIFGTFRAIPDRVIHTGVEGFPTERGATWREAPSIFVRQIAFPFSQAATSVRDAFLAVPRLVRRQRS